MMDVTNLMREISVECQTAVDWRGLSQCEIVGYRLPL